jgi:hypothetical protein
MATTTNYGWTTPDDTALVKDGAAAIRTLGSSVDTTTKNLNPSTTLGDIEYRSSTANTNPRLAIGSTGNILTVAGGVPTWAAPAGGGKVLQVVQGTFSTETVTTSSSYVDTGLTATITPSSASSKVMILVSECGQISGSGTFRNGSFNLVRTATEIVTRAENSFLIGGANGDLGLVTYLSTVYLDTPATTSATTYKTQMRVQNGTIRVCPSTAGSNSTSVILLLEIGA